MLLEEGSLLKEERERTRKLSRGIQSFSQRSAKTQNSIQRETSSSTQFGRCNSDFDTHHTEEGQSPNSNKILNVVADTFERNKPRDDDVDAEKKEELIEFFELESRV